MKDKKSIGKKIAMQAVMLALVISLWGVRTNAAEYTITPVTAILYTGSGAEIFAEPDPTTLVTVLAGNLPMQVTGATSNGYFQVLMNNQIYYIYGKALSVATGTNAYKLTSVDARAALVADADTGRIIYMQNPYERLAPASTTKIMTALLVMEAISQGTLTLETPVVVTPSALAGIPADASHVTPRLKAGEVMSVLSMLECMLVESDCSAGNVLAEYVAGSVDNFVALMNAKAAALGCVDTNFVNTSGYPADNHYTNAYSLFLITQAAMKHPAFQTIAAMPQIVVPATNMSAARTLESTDALIKASEYYNPYAVGIKTGSAKSSGLCFVGAAKKEGHTLISVILGASNSNMSDGTRAKQQFSETNKLFEIGFAGISN